MDVNTILLIIGLILAFIMAMNLGGNDAANPTSAAVGARVMSVRRAIMLFSVFALMGALLQGFMVMKTIGEGIVPQIDVAGALAIVLAANIWIFFATIRGMAISTTHSIICAVIGYGIVKFGIEGISLDVLIMIVTSWITSPICSLLLAIGMYKLIRRYAIKYDGKPAIAKFFKSLLIVSLCISAYAFGANDVANATGIYTTVAIQLGRMPDSTAMFILAIFGVAGIIVGGMLFGPKVIETLAFRVTRLDLTTGLAASLANAIVVYLFTTLPYAMWGYGLPISTSYAAVGSIIGASFARSRKSVNKSVSLTLVSYWMITVPVNILLAGAIYYLLVLLI